MALEFLHAEADIPEFVDQLYDRGYLLTYRCGPKRGTAPDRDTAVNKLRFDLCRCGSAYLIGTPERPIPRGTAPAWGRLLHLSSFTAALPGNDLNHQPCAGMRRAFATFFRKHLASSALLPVAFGSAP